MLYLDLPSSDGKLSAAVKEKILACMLEKEISFLTAAKTIGCSKAGAFHDYRSDDNFRQAVDAAEVLLVTLESEKILSLADSATSREDAAALSLKIKVREKMRDALIPKWREARSVGHVEQHLHQHEHQHITLSVKRQNELRAQRNRIIATSRDAQRTLHGAQSPDDLNDRPSKYVVPKQSLLVKRNT